MRTVLFLLCALMLSPLEAAKRPAPISDIDRIIAVVNNDVIIDSELNFRLANTKKQFVIEKIKTPPDSILRRQLLERMIIERIQLQLAAQTGIRVSDNGVEKAIKITAGRNNMTLDEFYKALSREGLDLSAYRNQIRDQITIRKLLEREINNRITVTDSEVNSFLENQENRASVNLEYHISHIFIGIPESASPEEIQTAKKRAETIHSLLNQSSDFAQAAVTHSQGQEALKGGDLGWKKAGQLPEIFLSALRKMRQGEISGVLRGPNGFHILKLNDSRGGPKTESVIQTHVRHILLRPSEIQSLEEAKNKLLLLRERVENGEDFSALARAHSEDTASVSNGGDLGWVSPRSLVPEFEKAMNALKPNQLSEPIQSPFGVHLIQVLERRSYDISQERVRVSARSQIHARKADERYKQWLRQLRDNAYVEYMLEDTN